MGVDRRKKRIFGVSVFLLMVMLAVGTMVSFANGESIGSYSMMITKELAAGAPDAANQEEYQFKIEGTISKSDGSNLVDLKDVEVTVTYGDGSTEKLAAGSDKVVKIKGAGSAVLSFPEGKINITAVEEIDADDVIEENEQKWSVTKTDCEAEMTIFGTEATIRISKPGGKIELIRPTMDANNNSIPEDDVVSYTLTGEAFHNGASLSGETRVESVAPGATVTLGENLTQGVYTIKEEKPQPIPGFEVLVGPRTIDVDANGVGRFYINGDESTLTIKAPALEADKKPRTHYYRIESVDGRTTRDIEVKTGQESTVTTWDGTVEHLPKGEYTIFVSMTYEGTPDQYTVTVPETNQTPRSWSFSYINGKRYSCKLDGDYMDSLTYGPVRKDNKLLPSGTKFKITYEATWVQPDGKTTQKINYDGGSRWARNTYNIGRTFVPGNDKKLIISVTPDVKPENFPGSVLPISWMSYKRVIKDYTTPQPEYTVDERGYITITKPEDPNDPNGEVVYTYTVTDSKGQTKTVQLHAGDPPYQVEGLAVGKVTVKEEITEIFDPLPFTVELNDTKQVVTGAGQSTSITILADRTVEISKPAGADDGRDYEFEIKGTDKEGVEHTGTIKLKAGNKTLIREQIEKLPEGTYTITAKNDSPRVNYGYTVKFNDGSTLDLVTGKQAHVTFTNTFKQTQNSYRVVHEYYDASYNYVGSTAVTTESGTTGEKYIADQVTKLFDFQGQRYRHVGEAYGKVVASDSSAPSVDDVVINEGEVWSGTSQYLTQNTGVGPKGIWKFAYKPLDNMNGVEATENGTQIIIIRYVQEETPVVKTGGYKVVHEYYYRTSTGDKLEGTRKIETVPVYDLSGDRTYTANDHGKLPEFRPEGAEGLYLYTYDENPAYGRMTGGSSYRADDAMAGVNATEAGEQIIILRYYREGAPGWYNVVHEYYYQEPVKAGEGSGETERDPEDVAGSDPDAGGVQGLSLTEPGGDDGSGEEDQEDGEFCGTLSSDSQYTYTYEGRTSVVKKIPAKAGESFTDGNVQKQFGFDNNNYQYNSAVYGRLGGSDGIPYAYVEGKAEAVATEAGDEIIILRYIRGDNPEPDPGPGPGPGPEPDPPGGGGDDPTPPPKDPDDPKPPEDPKDPEEPPVDPEEPPVTPEEPPVEPENPGYPTELPDPNDPNSPDEIIIWEDGVPKTYYKIWDPENEEYVYLLEEEIPLSWLDSTPKTGDSGMTALWAALAVSSLCGLLCLSRPVVQLHRRKGR